MEKVIQVRERSTQAVTEATYRELESSPSVLGLVEAGVLSFVRSRSVPFGVRAAAFVGQVKLNCTQVLSIDEKVHGTLTALLAHALPPDLRSSQAPSYVAADSPALEVFAAKFIEALGAALARGRIKQYEHYSTASTNPRGRIDIRRTAALRSAGVTTRLVSRRPHLSADNEINQTYALALHAVERLGRHDHVRVQARRLGSLFEDVPVHALSRAEYAIRKELCDRAIADKRAVEDVQRALQYARTLVLHLGYSLDDWTFDTPEAHFINLETLFEEAVRMCLVSQWGNDVVKGSVLKTPLFSDLSGQYVVDPDIVIQRAFGGGPLVGDVKYKDLSGLPDHSDVYQLAAHAHALGGRRAFLVYPGLEASTKRLGITGTGTEVWWMTVRPSNLADDLTASIAHVLSAPPQ